MSKDQVFSDYPSLKSYHQTSDGTKFFKKDHARNHSRSLKDKSLEEIKNPSPKVVDVSVKEAVTTKIKVDQNVDDLTPSQKAKLAKEAIGKLETVEAVEAALKDETYPSVIKAGAERIKALKLQTEKTGEGTGKENTGTDAPVNGTKTETKSEEEE
ncbi:MULTISPECIES: hypothetical protein [Bizionia]|uniref:Uncharacterized protein n=1 Tax=Bizionia algoritergicola TaxID=291187 RepID=A0A5D0R122_9FLAO|nr:MULTISPECIES: hypothetical protein [Bizionia]OBX20963.1 hypothetical protein BAA08_14590 [Bizionia sp. APA-3]TYB74586.1 hypothetical protein ES675_00130 [Bizionia algoritergicola]